MNKLLTLSLLSFTIACSAWAEKYEYVRLKYKTGQSAINEYRYITGDTVWSVDEVTLASGDVAELLSGGSDSAIGVNFWDGEDTYQFNFHSSDIRSNTIFGPGTIFLATTKHFSRWNSSTEKVINMDRIESIGLRIIRASQSGSTTLAWNGTEWEGSSDGSQQANNEPSGGIDPTSIKYDELLGWAYFTDTNWVYSYTNLSWYYMHSVGGDIYVWNANLPDDGWQKLERG